MGVVNREGSLYMATGIDTSGLYAGKREAIGIIKAMASEITSFDVFSGIGISAATVFAKAAKSSYDFEKEFRKNMLEVATISTQVTSDMTGFMNQVMSITQKIPVTAPEAAKALYQIVSAGHDGAAGMNVLEVATKSAIGGITDTVTAADAITTLLNAYKLSADDAEKVSDQLFTTARLGKTTFGELGQSIAQVAPIAAAYGVEMDQVLAAIATLTKSGTPTAQAMTQIRASIIGTSKVLGDGAFNTRTFQEALAEVANMAGGSESKLRELIPEVEAVNGVLGLTGIKAQDAADHLKEMNNSAGATEIAFKQMMDDVDKQMTLLSNNIQATLRPMGEAILKEVSEAAKVINQGFKTGNIQNNLENLKTLLVGVAGAFVTYKSAMNLASTQQAYESAKTAIQNNLKLLQSKITGEVIIAKEKERIYQEAYTASLEKTITEEQRAKLSKLELKTGSQEYVKAIADQALQEKKNADNLVESLTKVVAKNKEKLASAEENLNMSRKAVSAAKLEFDAAFAANDLAGVEIAQTKMNAAAQREEAASTNVATMSKQLKANQSKLVTATTVAETTSMRVNTAMTVADTAVTNVATAAKNRLKLAYASMIAVISANPIGALLTVVSLAATTYMLWANRIKEVETAQSRLNKLNKIAADNTANEQAELKLLLSVANNELVSKENREKAIKKLNDISPEYLGNLSLENIKTKEAIDSIEEYTKAIEKNAKMKAAQDMVADKYKEQLDYENQIISLQAKREKANKRSAFTSSQYGGVIINPNSKELVDNDIKYLQEKKAQAQKDIDQIMSFTQKAIEQKEPVSIPVNIQLEAEQSNISALMKKKEEIEDRITDKKGKGIFIDAFDTAELDAVNNELKKSNEYMILLNKEITKKAEDEGETVLKRKIDLTKELAEAQANLEKLRAPNSTAKNSEIKDAEDKVKKIKGKLEELTGISTKEGDKLKDTLSELSRLILDNELKLQAGRIAAMEDGKAKRIALAEQETRDTIAAIQKEKTEYENKIKESKGKVDSTVIVTFDNRELAAKEKEKTDIAKIDKEYAEEYKQRTKSLTDVFLSEEQRKLSAIKTRYDEERKWADQQLKTGGMTKEEHKSYTTTIDKSEKQETYRSLLDSLNDYKQKEKDLREKWDTDINAAVEAKDAYLVARLQEGKQKALSALNSQMLQESAEWMRLFGNLDTLTVNEINNLIDKIQNQLDSGTLKLNPVDAKALMDSLNQAKEKVAEKSPFVALAKSSEEMKKALADLKQAEDNGLTGEQLDVYKKKVKDSAEEVKKSIVAIGDAYGQVSDVMKSAADLIGMVDEGLGETVNNAISLGDAVMNVGEVVANAVIKFTAGMAAMESASVILLVIKAVLLAVMAAISLFNGDKKHEKKIKNLQEEVDTLKRSYDRLGEAIEDAYSTEKADLIDKESENLRQQNEMIRQQIQEEEDKKKTDKDKIKDWQNTIEDNNRQIEENSKKGRVEAIMGTDIKSAIDEFAQAYADAWASGEKAAGKSTDIVKNLIRTSIIEMLKSKLKPEVEEFMTFLSGAMSDGVIDASEQLIIDNWEKRLEGTADGFLAGKEKWLKDSNTDDVLGISSDSIADTIIDGLKAGKDGIKDFSSSFEDMMKTAVLNSLKTKYLEEPLKNFQKKFAELSESGGQLTEAEIEELRNMYADIIDGAKVQFDSLKDIAGLDFSVDSDNSLKGEFAKASQESISLLAGQAGATRVIMEDIKNQMQPIREQMQLIFNTQKEGWQDVKAIRELTFKIDKNSEQVAENTRQIKEVANKVADNTKRTAETLEGIINVKVKM